MQAHNAPQTERRFLFSLVLTSLIFIAELLGGLWTGSLALLSDSAHVFLDVFALGLSYGALRLSARPADARHTFGFHRAEVIAALINGVTLGVIAIGIFGEAWERWQMPTEIKSLPMLIIAVIGLVVNLVVALVLRGHTHSHTGHAHGNDHNHDHDNADYDGHSHTPAPGGRRDLNIESAFLHVVGDAISSVGVIGAALVIGFTGWNWVDPLASVLIGAMLLSGAWRVTRSALHILIEGTPEGVSVETIAATMTNTPGVGEVHDLHVWSLCSGHIALSAHALLDDRSLHDQGLILIELQRRLLHEHGIAHTTIQLERPGAGLGSLINIRPEQN